MSRTRAPSCHHAAVTRFGRRLESFHRRRIAIPVGPDALVLDVGSGDKPHWRADVLLDRYVDDDHGGQRSSGGDVRVSRPLFDADAADMPFADGVFDYVVCSHVLEHVPDPAAVIREITRVGRAGYIEVPDVSSAKILDFPSHLWWCRRKGDTLVFTAKKARAFDPDIARYIEHSGIEKRLEKLLDEVLEYRIIALHWEGTVDVRVEGTVDPQFMAEALAAEARRHGGETTAGRLLTAVMTLPHRGRLHRGPILYDDIVKPELRTGTGEVLERRVYRVERVDQRS
jgi:SAM-dependent methyltransferase